MSEYKPVGSTEIQTAQNLEQLSVAFTDGDDLLVLSTPVLVQPLPSPASHDLSSSWVVLAESPDLFQGTLEIVGRCVLHIVVHGLLGLVGLGHN